MRRRRKVSGAQAAVLGATGLIALGLPAWVFGGAYLKDRDAALSLRREWAVEGPPCPEIARAEFEARGLKVRKGTVYEDVAFYRQFGHVECAGLRYGGGWGPGVYPVCQFTSPKALRVTTRDGDRYFDIGAGSPATIAVPRGQVRCVLAANFTMARLNGRE